MWSKSCNGGMNWGATLSITVMHGIPDRAISKNRLSEITMPWLALFLVFFAERLPTQSVLHVPGISAGLPGTLIVVGAVARLSIRTISIRTTSKPSFWNKAVTDLK